MARGLWAGLQFVVEDGEAVDGGGLTAEDEWAKRDRQGTGTDGVDLSRGVVALGADPDGQFFGAWPFSAA